MAFELSRGPSSRALTAAALLFASGAVACEGKIGNLGGSSDGAPGSGGAVGGSSSGAGGGTSGTSAEQCADTPDSGAGVLRRLSKLEYQLSLQELFGLAGPPDVALVPEDGDQEGFRTIATLQNVSDQHLRAYIDIAAALAQALFADTSRSAAVLGCEIDDEGCLQSFVTSFGKLAYRRPLSTEEVSDLVTRARTAGSSQEDQFQYVIEALLASPSFLFRVEVGSGSEAVTTLTSLELASKLSFTLWGRTPSAALLARAEQGELDTPEGLSTIAQEMLADDKAPEFFRAFFKQWLNFEELRAPNTSPPGWSDALLADMIGETERVLDDFAWGPGASLPDALTANYTYVTPALGEFYGLTVQGAGLVRAEFPAGHQRANTGLLTHASLISSKSDGDLIAVRGKWLRGAFLCEDLHVPAGLLEELESELSGLSYAEVVTKRNTEGACVGCHSQIDPIGVGFAQYDAIGYYDPSVSTTEFGITPRFEGAANPEFDSLAELAAELKNMPALGACMAEKAFIYTQGRFPGDEDQCAIASVGERFAESGFGFPALLTAIVEAPSFRLRRAP